MNDSVKIMMWCVPRSCSTAFSKAISQQENSRIVMEPFADAYYYGTERVSDRYTDLPAKSSMTFSDIRQSLEQDYNDYSVVFAKDMAYYISEHMSRSNEVVPKGYKHVFLIRNPKKTVTSLYKNSIGKLDGFDYFDPAEAEFKSLHDLFFKLKEETGETPVLVDAADLLENPDRMLNLFCMKTGLPFSKEMLSWDQGGMKDLETAWPGWQATLTQSTGFTKPASPKPTEELQISEEAKQAIEDNMPYYNTLYQYRITY